MQCLCPLTPWVDANATNAVTGCNAVVIIIIIIGMTARQGNRSRRGIANAALGQRDSSGRGTAASSGRGRGLGCRRAGGHGMSALRRGCVGLARCPRWNGGPDGHVAIHNGPIISRVSGRRRPNGALRAFRSLTPRRHIGVGVGCVGSAPRRDVGWSVRLAPGRDVRLHLGLPDRARRRLFRRSTAEQVGFGGQHVGRVSGRGVAAVHEHLGARGRCVSGASVAPILGIGNHQRSACGTRLTRRAGPARCALLCGIATRAIVELLNLTAAIANLGVSGHVGGRGIVATLAGRQLVRVVDLFNRPLYITRLPVYVVRSGLRVSGATVERRSVKVLARRFFPLSLHVHISHSTANGSSSGDGAKDSANETATT